MNIYLINNKTNIFLEKYSFDRKKSWYFLDLRSDHDQLFHKTDPRIRIHIKLKRIRNTDKKETYFNATRRKIKTLKGKSSYGHEALVAGTQRKDFLRLHLATPNK